MARSRIVGHEGVAVKPFRHHADAAIEIASAVAGGEPAAGRGYVPEWFRRLGVNAWCLVGIALVFVGLCYVLHLLGTLVIPTLFAILLGATFLPAVDWLERHHIGRAWGALIVTVAVVVGALALLALMTVGIVRQWPTIEQQVQSGVDAVYGLLEDVNIDPDLVSSAKETLSQSAAGAAKGVFGGAIKGIESFASFLFGVFIGLNIFVYVLVGARKIGAWLSRHMGPVPPPVGYSILGGSARFLRGYIWGSTLIGLFNGLVVGVGALIIGTPLALTIGIVQWFSNYIPMFGALIGGAFAVLVALGTGGVKEAVFMLVFVLIANGPLQTVVSQFALGASLKLNGLVVLFVTTGGAVLAGALGGVFAAPLTKICIDAYGKLKAAGMLDDAVPATVTEGAAAEGAAAGPPSGGPGEPAA